MAYVVIGLGNPGGEYAGTRHNAGRMAAERFAADANLSEFAAKKTAQGMVADGAIGGQKVLVALPDTLMNASGRTAAALVKSKPAAKKLLVIRDDLDLPLGTIKLTGYGRGSGGQKGVESIARALRTKDFAQLKIGISSQTAKGKLKKASGEEAVVKHVLGKFAPREQEALERSLAKASEATRLFIEKGIGAAMLYANTK